MSVLDRLTRWLGIIAAWGFMIIAAMMVYEVTARYGFNAPTYWAHEIAGVLGATAFIFGGAYCMVDNSHLRITAIVEGRGRFLSHLSYYLSLVVGLIYLAGLTYASARMADDSFFRFALDGSWDPELSGTSWNTPAPSIIKFMLFLGAALFLALVVRGFFRRPPDADRRTD